MLSAQQLEEVNIETSRSRDLEKLINQDINVLSLSLLERQRSRVIGRGDEASQALAVPHGARATAL